MPTGFYASVGKCFIIQNAGKPLAVGGDPEARHGIVLTGELYCEEKRVKTWHCGSKTGMPRSDICATQNGFVFEVSLCS